MKEKLSILLLFATCSLSNHLDYAAIPAKQQTNARYYYPLAKPLFSHPFSNPLTVTALSAGACYVSFLYSLFNPNITPITRLSGITAIGSLIYAEYLYRKALYAIPVRQVTVRTQTDTTCVTHAIANALTVQKIISDSPTCDLAITTIDNTYFYDHIYELLLKNINTDPLLGLTQTTTAKLIELLNCKDTIFQIRYDQIGNTTHPEYVALKKQIARLYNQTDNDAIHIKCALTYPWDTTHHAIIISLVKINHTISLMYMDSNNVSLRLCPQAVEYIRFIYDNLLKKRELDLKML